MSRLEVLTGCWGAPPKEYPEDTPRCTYCYGGTCGSVFVDIPVEVYDAVLYGSVTVEELVEQGYLPPYPDVCNKTGARRFYTSTTLGE